LLSPCSLFMADSPREFSPREYSPRGKDVVTLADVGDCVIVDSAWSPQSAPMPSLPFDHQPDDANRPIQTSPPYFCMLVCAVCSLVFLAEIGRNGWGFQPFVCPASCGGLPCYEDGRSCESNPLLGPRVHVMKSMGAKEDAGIFGRGEWWRIVACNWLHVGLFHLLFNMLAVLSLGFPLERRFGWWRVASLYILSGLCGTMVSVVLLPGVVSLGASASVFGLVGATWADIILNHLARGRVRESGIVGLVFITIVNLLIGLTPWVDNFMHMGGFVAGLLIGLMLFSKKHINRRLGRLSFTRLQIVIVLIGSSMFAVRSAQPHPVPGQDSPSSVTHPEVRGPVRPVPGLLHRPAGRTSAPRARLSLAQMVSVGCIVLAVSSGARETLRECQFCARLNCVEITLFTSSPWWSCCLPVNGEGTCALELNTTTVDVFCNMTDVPSFNVPCARGEPGCMVDPEDMASVSGICQRVCSGCQR